MVQYKPFGGDFTMIYLTGDIHGDISKICLFIEKHNLSANDIIIILGDVGLNYYGNSHGDAQRKKKLNRYGVPIFCIHGNHEIRPYTIESYSVSSFHGGEVYVEEDYPNLIFAKDGEVYDFDGKSAIVLGGAYSVDKYYRFAKGLLWCDDEQPSDEIKQYCERSLSKRNWKTDYLLSHTCPEKHIPREAFIPQIGQNMVDQSTEYWLDRIEDKLTYLKWYCGHWHIDKSVDNLRFMMDDFVLLGD